MQIVALVSPPRCGVFCIATAFQRAGFFDCDWSWSVKQCEKILQQGGALGSRRSGREIFKFPLPAVRVVPDNADVFVRGIVQEAVAEGNDGRDVVFPYGHLLLPFWESVDASASVIWICIHRPPRDIEQSCVDTAWMPRAKPGDWGRYAKCFLRKMRTISKNARASYSLGSKGVFNRDFTRLETILAGLGKTFNGIEIGGLDDGASGV